MSKRRSAPKKLRFEIFKRDNFTCQYCGRKPPDVVLNLEHILAVSRGGGDNQENLVTACFDCNMGKGATGLEMSLPKFAITAEQVREKTEQLKALNAALEEDQKLKDSWLASIRDDWSIRGGLNPQTGTHTIPNDLVRSLKKFLQELPKAQVVEGMDKAFRRFPDDRDARFRYFCGFCWRKIKGDYPYQK